MKRLIVLLLCFFLLIQPASAVSYAAAAQKSAFGDVPKGHWAEEDIYGLLERGITNGVAPGRFGLGLPISRGEFVAFLVRLRGWSLVFYGGLFDDVREDKWYAPYIETAAANGVLTEGPGSFRPEEHITREEMAVMIVNTLGYAHLLNGLGLATGFPDVRDNAGYIEMASDFGIITGYPDGRFDPKGPASREQAAAMLMRMARALEKKDAPDRLHAFYAVSSSSQIGLISGLDQVSMGWARLETGKDGDIVLNTAYGGGNEYGVPPGWEKPVKAARDAGVPVNLMVTVKEERVDGKFLASYLINDQRARATAIDAIASILDRIDTPSGPLAGVFSGVVMDIELLRAQDRDAYTTFLAELKDKIPGKKLTVAVHPATRPGTAYYDGYDFRAIGELADEVILMAHDYNAKTLTPSEMAAGYTLTPLAPLGDVYYALDAITDPKTGVSDKNKITLQISFDSCQWKLDSDGRVINQTAYRPGYDAIYTRLIQDGVSVSYGKSQSPCARWTDASGVKNVLWYEDAYSVSEKTGLARMFGVGGVSLWRLGNVPDYNENTETARLNVWDTLTKNR